MNVHTVAGGAKELGSGICSAPPSVIAESGEQGNRRSSAYHSGTTILLLFDAATALAFRASGDDAINLSINFDYA